MQWGLWRSIEHAMIQVWPTIERFLCEHGAAVLVTLAQSQGSSPREVGARMMVRPDGRFSGTIGGGALEWLALAEAQSMMAGPGASFRRLNKALGPELGQCCGGRVVVTLERFGAADRDRVGKLAAAERAGGLTTIAEQGRPMARMVAPADLALPVPWSGPSYAQLPDGRIAERFGPDATPLYLFGAGHVGQSLVLALAPLPFAVTWIDPRAGAFPSHVPANVTCRTGNEPVALLERAPDGAFIAIMTHSHALDLDVAAAALRARRFPYVGLIGSATKRARFAGTLRQIGMGADDIDRLICPIGLTEIRDKAPAAIAAAVAAQLLIRREVVAAAAGTAPGRLADAGASHA
jgi:xanthine dehydrogenase accessory factor